MGLSTLALNLDLLGPHLRSGFNLWSHVSSPQHADYALCTAGLDFTHCHAAQHAARIQITTVWYPDPHQIQIQVPVWRAPMLNIRTN